MCKLSQLENIGAKFTALLSQVGIEDQKQLLSACRQKNQRLALSKQTGINPHLIFKWAGQADLARISGIGEEYAELLGRLEVDCISSLLQCSAEKLLSRMRQLNDKNKLVKQLPSLSHIESWIEQAKNLPPLIER